MDSHGLDVRETTSSLLQREERRKKQPGVKMQRLTADEEAIVEEKVKSLLQELNLSRSENLCSVTGNRHLATNSLKQYTSVYRGLQLFLKRIGDFMSLIIMREDRPVEFCPSLSVDSLMAYIDYKTLDRGTPIVILSENCSDPQRVGPVTDFFTKRQITASGTWDNPGTCNQLLSAISNLHDANGHTGPYSEPCSRCIEKYRQGRVDACQFHTVRILYRTGSPRECRKLKNRYTRLTQVDLADYEPDGASPLLPHELIRVRDALLSRNSLACFQLWVMILFHIQLFLRSSEGCSAEFNQVVSSLTAVNPETGDVQAICIKIKGKTDGSFN